MKKLSTTPSVFFIFKGIYIVFLWVLSTSSTYAQATKKDTSTFNKWEVSFDLKPLFRKDEPYNVYIKRYLSKQHAVRIVLGLSENSNNNESIDLIQESAPKRPDSVIVNTYRSNNSGRKYFGEIGYIREFQKKQLSVYFVSSLYYSKEYAESFPLVRELSLPFNRILKQQGFIENRSEKGIKLSLGLKYHFSNNLSISSELCLRWANENYKYETGGVQIYIQGDQQLNVIRSGDNFIFNPFQAFILNYSF